MSISLVHSLSHATLLMTLAPLLLKPSIPPCTTSLSAKDLVSYSTKKNRVTRREHLQASSVTSVYLLASAPVFVVFLSDMVDELFSHLPGANSSSWALETQLSCHSCSRTFLQQFSPLSTALFKCSHQLTHMLLFFIFTNKQTNKQTPLDPIAVCSQDPLKPNSSKQLPIFFLPILSFSLFDILLVNFQTHIQVWSTWSLLHS